MPYDKFEQAAPIEVLPNIQPQVDESMIRAVQTASQAFEARAKRKQEEEQAASAAKAAERKRLLDYKVDSIDVPAYQKEVSGKANEIIGNAMQGVDSPYLKQEVTDIIEEGKSLKNFAQTLSPAIQQTQKVWGEKNVNISDSIKNFSSKLNDPNLTREELQKERQIVAEDLANIPTLGINMAGVFNDLIDNRNKNREALDVTFSKTTPTKETSTTTKTKARLWVDTNENMIGVDGKPLIDPSTGQIIKRQRPAETLEDFKSIAPEILQTNDGKTGVVLQMQVEKQLGDKLNKATEENLKNLKQTIFSQNIQKGIYTPIDKLMTKEEEQAANDEFRKGYLQEATLNKAVELLQNQQQAHLAGVTAAQKIFAPKTSGSGAGEKEKVATIPYASNVFNVNLTDPNGKIKETQAKSFGTVVTTKDGKPVKYVVSDITAFNARTGLTEDFTQNVNVENAITRFMPYRLGKNTGQKIPISIVPKEGEDKAQWGNKSMLQTIKDLPDNAIKQMQGFTPITYFTTVASGAENVKLSPEKQTEYFELDARFKNKPVKKPIAPVKGDKDYDRKLTAYQNAIPKYEEYKRYLEYKEMMPKQADDFYTDTKNVQANIEAVTGQKYDETSLFNRLPKDQQQDFIKAKAEFERRKRELSSSPAKVGETKGGKTAEKGKIKIVGTKPLVNFNQ